MGADRNYRVGKSSGLHQLQRLFLIQEFLSSHSLGISPYIPVIIWFVLFLIGIITVVIRGKGGGRFTWTAIIFTLPSLLAFNSMDLPRIFGLDVNINSNLHFYQLLGLEILIMTGYILINHMYVFKQSHHNLIERGADAADIDNIYLKSHLFLFQSTAAILLMALIVALLSTGLESFTLSFLKQMSWNMILVSLGCILVVAIYIYWIGSKKNTGL